MEFYLLNYFKAGTGEETGRTSAGRALFKDVGCATCHVPSLTLNRDRRVADVETVFNPTQGVFNRLFSTAAGRFTATDDGTGHPTLKQPSLGSFVVATSSQIQRHDPARVPRAQHDGTFVRSPTTSLGRGPTAPNGQDGSKHDPGGRDPPGGSPGVGTV